MSGTRRRLFRRAACLSERLFRLLLLAYPKRFRETYAQEMAHFFRDLLHEERHQEVGGFVGLWRRMLLDIAWTALRERNEEMQGRGYLLLGAIALGLAITWVDARPTWDDTGITAGAIFLCCALLSAISPQRAWQWALAVGVWIPLHALLFTRNYGALLALLPAFLGATLGVAVRYALFGPPDRA